MLVEKVIESCEYITSTRVLKGILSAQTSNSKELLFPQVMKDISTRYHTYSIWSEVIVKIREKTLQKLTTLLLNKTSNNKTSNEYDDEAIEELKQRLEVFNAIKIVDDCDNDNSNDSHCLTSHGAMYRILQLIVNNFNSYNTYNDHTNEVATILEDSSYRNTILSKVQAAMKTLDLLESHFNFKYHRVQFNKLFITGNNNNTTGSSFKLNFDMYKLLKAIKHKLLLQLQGNQTKVKEAQEQRQVVSNLNSAIEQIDSILVTGRALEHVLVVNNHLLEWKHLLAFKQDYDNEQLLEQQPKIEFVEYLLKLRLDSSSNSSFMDRLLRNNCSDYSMRALHQVVHIIRYLRSVNGPLFQQLLTDSRYCTPLFSTEEINDEERFLILMSLGLVFAEKKQLKLTTKAQLDYYNLPITITETTTGITRMIRAQQKQEQEKQAKEKFKILERLLRAGFKCEIPIEYLGEISQAAVKEKVEKVKNTIQFYSQVEMCPWCCKRFINKQQLAQHAMSKQPNGTCAKRKYWSHDEAEDNEDQ